MVSILDRVVDAKAGEQLVDSTPLPKFSDEFQKKLDEIEIAIATGLQGVECPVRHIFTPGLYSREIFMPRGSVIMSKIHKTEHPYVVSQGKVHVFIEGIGWNTYSAPYIGVTKPRTRRVLLIEQDCVWTTFHVTDKTDIGEIEKDIIEPRLGHFLEYDSIARKQLKEEN